MTVATRYSSVVKLQGGTGNVCTVPAPNTTTPGKEIVMPSQRTMPRVCRRCNADFFARVSEVNAGGALYCSQLCASKRPDPSAVLSEDGLSARIPLRARDGSVRAYAVVDAADAVWVGQWHWSLKGPYVVRGATEDGRNQTVMLHRELLGLPVIRGDGPEGDHIDRDTLNNRRSNLRIATKPIQQQNIAPRGASSYRGVSWITTRQKWQAKVTVNRKVVYRHFFRTEIEAARAAQAARAIHLPFSVERDLKDQSPTGGTLDLSCLLEAV